MDILKEKMNQGNYREVIELCKNALSSCPNEPEIWYTMFLAENENFTRPLQEISGEMEFNKALSLADSKRKTELEGIYRICKSLSQIPVLPSLYLAICSGDKENILRYLEAAECLKGKYKAPMDSEFTATAFRIMAVKKEEIYNVFFYLCTKCTEESGFHEAFQRTNKDRGYTDDDTLELVKKWYKEQLQMDEIQKERDKESQKLKEIQNDIEDYREKIRKGEEEIQSLKEKIRSLDARLEAMKNDKGIHGLSANVKKGDLVSFGRMKDGSIKWMVLDVLPGRALLLSMEILKSMPMDRFSNNYLKSSLRGWLNQEFYSEAFTMEEKKYILKSHVDNSPSSLNQKEYGISNPYSCPDTKDYLFLLSAKEISEYFKDPMTRKCHGVKSAKTSGLYVSKEDTDSSGEKTSYWWLRSPAYAGSDCMQSVGSNGTFHYNYVNDMTVGVRPAMWVRI